jgi:membrane protein implicated in regulation of membrane protease activity
MYQVIPEEIVMFPTPFSAEVEEPISSHRSGRISCLASYWFAKLYHPQAGIEIPIGQTVTVIGREGITLLVIQNRLSH